MNADDNKFTGNLPEVQSPLELDERILAEARNRVPEKPRFFQVRWMPAMAGVCAVAVAIVVARPVIQSLQAPVEVEATLPASVSIQTVTDAPMDSDEDDSAKLKKAHSELARSRESQTESLDQAKAVTATAYEPELQAQKQEGAATGQVMEENSLLENKSLEKEPMKAVSMPTAQNLGYSDSSSSVAPIDIEEQLDEIRRLVAENKTEEAQALLDLLHIRCPECELPETVEKLE